MTEDSLTARALHEEAQQARAEIRAAGICCPSCGVNTADLPDGHNLVLTNETHPGLRKGLLAAYAECGDGQRICLLGVGVEMLKAAANVSMFDQMRSYEDHINWFGFPPPEGST